MAERSEAKSAKRSFASKYIEFWFLTRSYASRYSLRYAIFRENKATNLLVTLTAEVKLANLIMRSVISFCVFFPAQSE
jgi:hypothetical protein